MARRLLRSCWGALSREGWGHEVFVYKLGTSRRHFLVDTFNVDNNQMLTNEETLVSALNCLFSSHSSQTPRLSTILNQPSPIHTLSTSVHVFRICYIFLFWQSYCCCCPLTGQCFLSFLLVHDHHDHHPAHSPTAAMSSLPLPAKSADDPSYVPPVYSTRRKPWMGKHKFYPPRETKQASTLMELASSKYLILYRP